MMLSGINVFKSTLFFLAWAEVLLHLEHKSLPVVKAICKPIWQTW